MTLRNEIFEGIAAMKGTQEAFGNSPRDQYYRELAKTARRENDDWDARRIAREKAIAAGRPTPLQPRVLASAGTPGAPVVQQAFSPTAMPAQQVPGGIVNFDQTYSKGGKVRKARYGMSPDPDRWDPNAEPETPGPGPDDDDDYIDPETGWDARNGVYPQDEGVDESINVRHPVWLDDKPVKAMQNGGMVRRDGGPVIPDDNTDDMPPFDPEGDGYDYRTARLAGVQRGPDGHMGSRDPVTGMQLKGRRHPTFNQAIETDRMEGYGLEKRNGRYYTQKFAGGGTVLGDQQRKFLTDNTRAIRQPGAPTPGVPGTMELADEGRTLDDIEGYENEADGIVKQLLGQDQGTTDKINASITKPEEPLWTPQGDIVAANTREEVRARRARNAAPGGPSHVEGSSEAMSPPEEPPQDVPRQGTLRASAGNRERTRASIDTGPPPEIDYPNPLPTSSRLGRAVEGILPTPDPNWDEKERLETEMYDTRPGLFEQTTEPDRQVRAKRLEDLQGERAALDAKSGPPAMTGQAAAPKAASSGLPSVAMVSGPVRAPPGDPDHISQLSMVPRAATTRPNQTPANGAAVTGQGSRVSGQTNGPPVSNPQPGPTGTAGDRAPPAGSAPANTPSGAPKAGPDDTAPGPNGTRVARGSLQDQTRTKAFDPVADFNDPGRAPATTSLASYTPQDFTQVMQGAASVAKQGPVGQGAISRENFNAYTAKHSQGGQFTPGEAMLVGMMSDYKMLLAQGRVDQANKMAYGLIQAASLEAASYGMVARDALKAGDHVSALNNGVMALNYLPDGKTFKASPDGKTITAYNAQTGQPTGSAQVSPQQLLALITGIADGSLLWQALQTSAAMIGKPDRNAEGRKLTNDLRREQIEGAKLRNAKLRSGGGGKGTSGFSEPGARLNALLSGGQRGGGSEGTAPRAQGDDTDYINIEVQDPAEPPE